MQQPTIRIRKHHDGPWIAVPLLAIRLDWIAVDDGLGWLWVRWECCHTGDLLAAIQAHERRN